MSTAVSASDIEMSFVCSVLESCSDTENILRDRCMPKTRRNCRGLQPDRMPCWHVRGQTSVRLEQLVKLQSSSEQCLLLMFLPSIALDMKAYALTVYAQDLHWLWQTDLHWQWMQFQLSSCRSHNLCSHSVTVTSLQHTCRAATTVSENYETV